MPCLWRGFDPGLTPGALSCVSKIRARFAMHSTSSQSHSSSTSFIQINLVDDPNHRRIDWGVFTAARHPRRTALDGNHLIA